ncbi:MAG: hypothetical protein ACLFWD_00415 [Anaerolineales bacterium]
MGKSEGERLPGYRIQPTLEAIQRLRRGWGRYHQPDDLKQLLRIFRKIELEQGYQLDYISLRRGGVHRIWPYARSEKSHGAPASLQEIPPDRLANENPGGLLSEVEAETLYRHISCERSPLGFAEYAFFVMELWAFKSQGWADDWLGLEPLVVRHAFDSVLRKSPGRVVRVSRPDHYDPTVIPEDRGARVHFMAYQPKPLRRILHIEVQVEASGHVRWQPQEVVASFQRG